MGSYWDALRDDRDRRRRIDRRTELQFYRAAAAEDRRTERASSRLDQAQRAELARQERAAGEAEATRRTADLAAELARLARVLRDAVGTPPRTPAALRAAVPATEPEPAEPTPARPEWSRFAPPEPGWPGVARLVGRRHDRALADAQTDFQRALREHERVLREAAEARRRRFTERAERVRGEHHRRWDTLTAGLDRGDPDSVSEVAAAILHAVPALHGLLAGGQGAYRPEPRELVVQLALPEADVIPTGVGWRYTRADGVVELHRRRSPAEVGRRYTGLVSQLTLAAMNALFRGLPGEIVDIVTANGHVPTTDPATGRAAEPCIITVTADRSTFAELDLGHPKLDPARCLQTLGAELSPHPFELAPVQPFVDIELARYRFAMGPEALAALDHRTDLLTMDPYRFELLVKDLFDRMGYRAWRTRSSHDDGIDAVAIRDDLLTPVHCLIQVKRYKNRVSPEKIQALMGVLAENPDATNGVLVTTSWFSDRARQRARAQRIKTIEGSELVRLLKDHLDLDVLIGLPGRRQSS